MNIHVIIIFAAYRIAVLASIESEIERINRMQNYWQAGKNDILEKGTLYMKGLLGARIDSVPVLPIKEFNLSKTSSIPKTFDARKQWPSCPSISDIYDQGKCASCWAVAATTCMTDRLCISGGANGFVISTENLLSCCSYCGGGCKGGSIQKAWRYFAQTGIVTGGPYHSHKGCQPYAIPPSGVQDNNNTTELKSNCRRTCTNNKYSIPYKDDKHYGVRAYSVHRNIVAIQNEILNFGPVGAVLYVYKDFMYYKSGVYVRTMKKKYMGVHAVKIFGWGTENGVDYWLAANSWNKHWGHHGTFKIRRGTNECQIESYITAGSV